MPILTFLSNSVPTAKTSYAVVQCRTRCSRQLSQHCALLPCRLLCRFIWPCWHPLPASSSASHPHPGPPHLPHSHHPMDMGSGVNPHLQQIRSGKGHDFLGLCGSEGAGPKLTSGILCLHIQCLGSKDFMVGMSPALAWPGIFPSLMKGERA